jgi:chromosome segregation ATPase
MAELGRSEVLERLANIRDRVTGISDRGRESLTYAIEEMQLATKHINAAYRQASENGAMANTLRAENERLRAELSQWRSDAEALMLVNKSALAELDRMAKLDAELSALRERVSKAPLVEFGDMYSPEDWRIARTMFGKRVRLVAEGEGE